MKKRILKLSAFIVAVLLILGVAWFANGLVGNPISKTLATNTAQKHLETHYADKDFTVDEVMFSFKDGYYHAFVSSPSSIDSNFTILVDMLGKLRYDTYEDRVLSKENTANRIGTEYRNKVNAILDSQLFPYDAHIGYGDITFVSESYKDNPSVPNYALMLENLTLDAFYDINELGGQAGKITIYLYDDTITYERLAEIVIDVKSIFDEAGVKFYALNLVLESPRNEDGTTKQARVEVLDFPYADIYKDGMVERVKASDEAANAYYAEQDALKAEEML